MKTAFWDITPTDPADDLSAAGLLLTSSWELCCLQQASLSNIGGDYWRFVDFGFIAQFVLDAWQPVYFLIAEMGIL